MIGAGSSHFPQSVSDFVSQYREPEEQVLFNSQLPWLKLSIDAPFKEMYEEAKTMEEHFVKHSEREYRDPENEDRYHHGWFSINLHNMTKYTIDKLGGIKQTGYDHYNFWKDHARAWTTVARLCPVTQDYFKNVFPMKTYYKLRFMLLKPGGYVEPHNDIERGEFWQINISLNNPNGCFLVTEKGTVPFDDQGSVFLFNPYYNHSVVNNSKNVNRYHIIIHGAWEDTNKDIQKAIMQYGERRN